MERACEKVFSKFNVRKYYKGNEYYPNLYTGSFNN